MGETTVAPKNIQIKEPITDKVFKDHVRIYWDDTAPYIVIHYELKDDVGRTLSQEFVKIEGAALATFLSGFGATLKTNAEASIWADIQAKYTTVDK